MPESPVAERIEAIPQKEGGILRNLRARLKRFARAYTWEGAILLLMALAGIVTVAWEMKPLAMKKMTMAEILAFFEPLFFIIVFVERSIEVIVSTCREPDLASLKQKQLTAKAGLDWLKRDKGRTPAQRDEAAKPLLERHDHAGHALIRYQTQTRQWALVMSLGFGLTLGLFGLRIMEPLLAEPPALGLRIVDVLLTGSFIAGGSHGVHMLINEILNLISLGKRRP